MAAGAGEDEEVRYRVKPMNCPMHALIFKSQQRSYRDLPLRLSEVANVYRNEKSGTLHGLLRVRGLSMDGPVHRLASPCAHTGPRHPHEAHALEGAEVIVEAVGGALKEPAQVGGGRRPRTGEEV